MDQGVDWAAVGLAATVATAFATGISTATALWWRRQDRSQPDWFTSRPVTRWQAKDNMGQSYDPHVDCSLSNTGDAPAFRVTVAGLGCRAQLYELVPGQSLVSRRDHPVWVMAQPGASMKLTVWCEPNDWDEAQVLLSWVQSPTWKNQSEELRLPLALIAPRPAYMQQQLNEDNGRLEYRAAAGPTERVLPDHLSADRPLPEKRAGWRRLAKRRAL